jgi:hypothetical protein
MLAKLTGGTPSTIKRHGDRARWLEAGEGALAA